MPEVTGDNWLDMAKELVEQRREVLAFIARVQDQFPRAQRRHAAAVVSLWLTANELDQELYGLLGEMSQHLLEGRAEQDTVRGATVGTLGVRPDVFYYNCSWLLAWGQEQGVTIDLAIDPEEEIFFLHVLGIRSGQGTRIAYPSLNLDAVREALVAAFVAEVTVDDCPEAVDTAEPALEQPDVSDLLRRLNPMPSLEGEDAP